MKILVVCHEYPPLGGGAGRQSMNLAGEYAKEHEVYFLTVGLHEFGIFQQNGYTLHKINAFRKNIHSASRLELLGFVYAAWNILPQITRAFAPDVVHFFFAIPEGLLLFHPCLRNVPSIISVRGADVPGHDTDRFAMLYKILRPIVKRIWKKANKVVSNSDDLKQEVVAISPGLHVDVIPNGVNTQKFAPLNMKKETDELVLLYVGRLIPRKQIDVVIRSIVELKKALADKTIVFRIVGIGWQQTALEELVNELHLEENVMFVGEVNYDRIQQEYQTADIYIQLSKTEGMSNSILESMSCGLPVITTNVGGASEFMDNNGFIIEPSVEAVVECVKKYADDYALIDNHGQQSRLLADKFSLEHASQQYLEIFRSSLQDNLLG